MGPGPTGPGMKMKVYLLGGVGAMATASYLRDIITSLTS